MDTKKVFASVALIAACTALTLSAAQFVWDGKTFTGWREPSPNPFWTIKDGILKGENNAALTGSMLYTDREFKDFVLEADVRWSGEIDSGFMFRKPELQMQIGVSRSLKTDMTGSYYTGGKDAYPIEGRAKEASKLVKPGEWNHFKLQTKGNTVTTWINGTKASEYTNPKYAAAGPIGLQIHPKLAMKVEFRNIRIKDLE